MTVVESLPSVDFETGYGERSGTGIQEAVMHLEVYAKWKGGLLVRAKMIAALMLSPSLVHASWNGDVAVYSGYRQDTQSFSVCAGLNTPEYFGFGKLRGRQVHIWEVGFQGQHNFSEQLSLAADISYGSVLGGRVRDTGVVDILANPFNSLIGQVYADCCAPSNCQSLECQCPCAKYRTFAPSVAVTASASGHVWDVYLGLDYAFKVLLDFALCPSIGYAFNQQRTVYSNTAWGPVQAQYTMMPCAATTSFTENFSILETTDPDYRTIALVNYWWSNEADTSANCISFGSCLNGTTYRSSWNGGFIGLNLDYVASHDIALALGYRFYLQQFSGRFSVLGGCARQSCLCDLCPTFLSPSGDVSLESVQTTAYDFQPADLKFKSISYGQEVYGRIEQRCGDRVYTLFGGWQYRRAGKCSQADCDSAQLVRNGHMDLDGPTSAVAVDTEYPVWTSAALQHARWSSWRICVAIAQLF